MTPMKSGRPGREAEEAFVKIIEKSRFPILGSFPRRDIRVGGAP
jgi:hypothetical protein